MGGFPTNQPLTLRRQNLSFLVNMQETDQACGLKGAEEQHCRRTSYLTVRCKMLICFAASETEQLDEFDLISKTFSFFSIRVSLLCLTLSTGADLKRLEC